MPTVTRAPVGGGIRLPGMADSSFDIVSKVDHQEADNALQQARKEVEQRYDFKGTGASIEWSGEAVLIKASTASRRTRSESSRIFARACSFQRISAASMPRR